jgi:capsular exopolysaccharide synthesis family protein
LDLRDYLRVLRKGWPLILAFVILGLAAGIGLTLSTTKVYEASAQLYVYVNGSNSSTDGSNSTIQNNAYAQSQVQSYVKIANQHRVTAPTISDNGAALKQKFGLVLTPEELGAKITADAPLNEVLINLHVTDHDPEVATTLANDVANEFVTQIQNLVPHQGSAPIVSLSVVAPATVPGSPIKPNKLLNIGLGFVVGLLVGVGVVVLRDVLDNTIKDGADFSEAGVPTMGVVPFDKRTVQTPIAFRADPNSARSEAYRQIRTNLQFVNVDNPPRIISVTSALPGEGKSTTALNLAAALAEAGSRVCLIEADLRRPSLAKALGLVGDVGFTTALIGKTPVQDVLQNAGQNLAVLTSGPIPPNPSELLITDHARQIIQEVASHVDFVVIDTPPLLPVTDGATVATLADATLLVARTGKTTRDQSARSLEALEKVGRTPVGVVLNMVTRGRGGYSYEYGYYYTANERPDKMGRSSVGVAGGHEAPDDPTSLSDPMDREHGAIHAAPAEPDESLAIMSEAPSDGAVYESNGHGHHAAEPASEDAPTGELPAVNGDSTQSYPAQTWQAPTDEQPTQRPHVNGQTPNGDVPGEAANGKGEASNGTPVNGGDTARRTWRSRGPLA